MVYRWYYQTPPHFSDIVLNSDGEVLTGLWFIGSRGASRHADDCIEEPLAIFAETCRWLDLYFAGQTPDFIPTYKLLGATKFRRTVSEIMLKIPFGQTTTYHDIAKEIATRQGLEKMSAQAVGGAVGWNPICIIVPCHRVVATSGDLTGYGGGIKNKIALLMHERGSLDGFTIPKRTTVL